VSGHDDLIRLLNQEKNRLKALFRQVAIRTPGNEIYRTPERSSELSTDTQIYEVHDNYFDSRVVWEEASDQIPAGPDVQSTGSVSVPYSYTLDSSGSVPAAVTTYAGVGKI
jgi:pectate lyase